MMGVIMRMCKGVVVVLAGLLVVASGCSSFQKSDATNDQKPQYGTEAPNKVTYSFPDIPVPTELSLVKDKSFIYETPGMKVGVLVLRGNLDVASLENYFRVNMPKSGWRFVNSYKYGDTILNFTKEERSSNIRIKRVTFSTDVEIWVGPIERSSQSSGQRGDGSR
jgi:hypothetical protein